MSDVITLVMISVAVTLGALSCLILIRNDQVYRYRIGMIEKAGALARADIAAGRFGQWHRHFERLEQVTYDRMMLQFWRPLASFYDGDEAA